MTAWTGGAAVAAPKARGASSFASPLPGAVVHVMVAVAASMGLVIAVIMLGTLLITTGAQTPDPPQTALPTAIPGLPPQG